jgi:hypothetical protein
MRKPPRKGPLGRSRHRWQIIFTYFLIVIECEGVDWIDLAHDRDRWWVLAHTVVNTLVR